MSSFAFTYLVGYEVKRELQTDCSVEVTTSNRPSILTVGSGVLNRADVGGWTSFLTDATETECNPYKCKFSDDPSCCNWSCDYEYEVGDLKVADSSSPPFMVTIDTTNAMT